MRIKSYFAGTVEEGMAQARAELGPDAMLVNSRKTAREARHLGEYEVVIAADLAAAPEEARTSEPGKRTLGGRLSVEVAGLKKELEGMRRAIARSTLAPAVWRPATSRVSDAYAALAGAELAPELARDIVQRAESRLSQTEEASGIERAIADELESRIMAEPALGRPGSRPGIAALVGPPGAGKTTMLVKLAVTYGLAARRPVLLLSTDTYRIAAAEQLRVYAAILGVGFQVLETAGALAQAIEENRGKELILIDTPGLAGDEGSEFSPLAAFLATRDDIDTQLVVPASMKPGDLSRVVDRFDDFGPKRLIFTRLDETATFGPLLNEAVRTGKPISFLGTGQRIPEDLEAASRQRIAGLILAGAGAQEPTTALAANS